ncbi:histidinol-phosphate aminotransferase [Spinellus fusiger]|nr:histidinol-phosphate aminotransferase [Spinellus fusiger]
MPFSLEKIIRPNILSLAPYHSARDDYSTGILLDANENAYGPALTTHHNGDLHRYPSPSHWPIKERIVQWRGVPSVHHISLGVGSDEVIDFLVRVACVPGKDKILITPPTYGMYSVVAQVNDVGVVRCPLTIDNGSYQLCVEEILESIKTHPVKIIFLCSPGNPTGTCLSHDSIRAILGSDFDGIVVVDEAYVDFVEHQQGTVSKWIKDYPNLVVMQTLSKSFGLAGIRLGIALGNPKLIKIINNIKAPYNIGTPTAMLAYKALSEQGLAVMKYHRSLILKEREKLIARLGCFPVQGVGRILGSNDANFILVQILNKQNEPCNDRSKGVYTLMADTLGVVVRFRGTEHGCLGCLRMTVGTEEENSVLLKQLEKALITMSK